MTAAGAMNITDFLQERIAEDESEAEEGRWVFDLGGREGERLTYRVLAECKAKREIVDECERSMLNDGDSRTAEWIAAQLAAVYSSHPDYDPAWAPESRQRKKAPSLHP